MLLARDPSRLLEVLQLVTCKGTKISEITVDSGAGTPESLLRELELLQIIEPSASAQSCGLHDIMSIF